MSIRQIRIGVFQLSSHPAVCLADRDMLMEPIFPMDDERSLTVLAREVVELHDCLANVKTRYIKWHSERLDRLLEWLHSQSARPDILVFPECGIPFECLERLRWFSEQTGAVVFAGTHTPKSDTPSVSHYKKTLRVRDTHFNDFRNQPPPAVLPIITPKVTKLHRKSVASIFEQQDIRTSHNKVTKTRLVTIGEPAIRVTPLVCAEALHLTSWDDDLPELVIIVAMERNPSRFDSLIASLVSNKVPVVLANDGAYGGSGVFAAVDRRRALWWFAPPNYGKLPVCDAYLEVSLNLSAPTVEVDVSNPGQPASLTRLSPILSADNPTLSVEQQLKSAAEHRNAAALKALRLDFADQLSHAPLTSRRLAFVAMHVENGTLTDDIVQAYASHLSLAPHAGIKQLEIDLATLAADQLSGILQTESTNTTAQVTFQRP